MKKSIGMILLIGVFLAGCTTVLNRYKPFSDYVGTEVELLRPCVLEVSVIANDGSQLSSYWENDQPTELVYDDRMFVRPVRKVTNDVGLERKLYPASDYPKRGYVLRETESWAGSNRNYYGGPYRIFKLPAGTKLFIEKAYTFNGIDSITHGVNGFITIPQTAERVRFAYVFSDGPSARGTMNDYIARAPWEDDSAPAERFIGWTGKGH